MNGPRWDGDNKPGAPSSMDVLMQWIRAPGSRQRWHQRAKRESCEEVARQLRARGFKRTANAVLKKMLALADQCDSAAAWLQQRGMIELYHRGEADQNLPVQVEQRCPHYQELSRFFQAVVEVPSAVSVSDNSNGASALVAPEPARNMQELDANTAGPRDKQKRKREPRTNSAPPKKRQKQETRRSAAAASVLQSAKNAARSASPAATRQSEGDSTDTAASRDTKDDLSRRLLECELQQKEDLARCHLEGEREREQVGTNSEQKREEIRMNCEKLLSRHKLLSAGVTIDVVDRAFPL